jgi:hypothetical protein
MDHIVHLSSRWSFALAMVHKSLHTSDSLNYVVISQMCKNRKGAWIDSLGWLLMGELTFAFWVWEAVPEIEQAHTDAVWSEVSVSFTPNLMPMILTSTSQMEFPPTRALGLSHHVTQDVHLVNEELYGYLMFYYVVTEPQYDVNNVYVVTEPRSDINNVYVVTEPWYDVNNEGGCVMSWWPASAPHALLPRE